VHGAVENRKGIIAHDKIRLDAKFKIVPDQDYADLFSFCVRLLANIIHNEALVGLLEQRGSDRLNDWYLRLVFQGA